MKFIILFSVLVKVTTIFSLPDKRPDSSLIKKSNKYVDSVLNDRIPLELLHVLPKNPFTANEKIKPEIIIKFTNGKIINLANVKRDDCKKVEQKDGLFIACNLVFSSLQAEYFTEISLEENIVFNFISTAHIGDTHLHFEVTANKDINEKPKITKYFIQNIGFITVTFSYPHNEKQLIFENAIQSMLSNKIRKELYELIYVYFSRMLTNAFLNNDLPSLYSCVHDEYL